LRPERGVNLFEETLRDLLASGHRARFQARGDSMHPTIRNGEAVEIAPCVISEVRRDDIVLASIERGLTLHRVVHVSADGIVMRGDNAWRADPLFGASQLLGRVVNYKEITHVSRPFDALVKIIRTGRRFGSRLRYHFQQFSG
jgi:phage repressor protein C with HTH and peptisase S24 domain